MERRWGVLFFELLAGLPVAEVQTGCIGSFRVGDLARRGKHVPGSEGRTNVGLRLQLFAFCFCDGDDLVIIIEIL